MTTATAAIANHLNIAEAIIASVEEWAHVLFVRFIGRRPRFVSKKVVKMDSVIYKAIEMKPVTKAVMDVYKNGAFFKRMDINSFALTCLDIPARQHGEILFDLRSISGMGNKPKDKKPEGQRSSYTSRLNPQWVSFNNINNEGATDGFNPYPKYI